MGVGYLLRRSSSMHGRDQCLDEDYIYREGVHRTLINVAFITRGSILQDISDIRADEKMGLNIPPAE